jgi:hypothetical protein
MMDNKLLQLLLQNLLHYNTYLKKIVKQVSPTIAGEKTLGIGESQFKKIFGLSYGDVAKNWKDKGGFEGLMANPGFTLGLAMMSIFCTR